MRVLEWYGSGPPRPGSSMASEGIKLPDALPPAMAQVFRVRDINGERLTSIQAADNPEATGWRAPSASRDRRTRRSLSTAGGGTHDPEHGTRPRTAAPLHIEPFRDTGDREPPAYVPNVRPGPSFARQQNRGVLRAVRPGATP